MHKLMLEAHAWQTKRILQLETNKVGIWDHKSCKRVNERATDGVIERTIVKDGRNIMLTVRDADSDIALE